MVTASVIGLKSLCLNRHVRIVGGRLTRFAFGLLVIACQRAPADQPAQTHPTIEAVGASSTQIAGNNEMPSVTREQLESSIRAGSKMSLNGKNLQKLDLSSLNLSEFDFSYANLDDANLQHANLSKAILWSIHAHGTDFRHADLRGANLATSDLSRANLKDANLRGANLMGVSLDGADLRGADLREANLLNLILGSAIHDATTYWPAGYTP